MILVIIAVNVIAVTCTLCVGLLVTIPASYMLIFSYQLVGYCESHKTSYFLDKDNIVRFEKSKKYSRQDFFRGE